MWLFGYTPKRRTQRKRQDERFNSELLTTPLGQVKDLSRSGIRVHSISKPVFATGQVLSVKLQAPDGHLTFMGRVVWIKRLKKGYDAGIRLLDVKPHIAAMLKQLAEFGFTPSTEWSEQASGGGSNALRMGSANDPYQVLGVEPEATDEKVQQAYRRLARMLHPDVNRSADAAAQFARVTAAYRALQKKRQKTTAA